jgi:hypothetical protein
MDLRIRCYNYFLITSCPKFWELHMRPRYAKWLLNVLQIVSELA